MKNVLFAITTALFVSLSSNVYAGAVKEVLMDAEDAIYAEFYQNGRQVTSITDQKFVPVKGGIGVGATVETVNPENGYAQTWSCVVAFERVGNSYSPRDVNCSGL